MKKHCITCTLLLSHGIALAFVKHKVINNTFYFPFNQEPMIVLNSLGSDPRFLGLEKEGEVEENCITLCWHVG